MEKQKNPSRPCITAIRVHQHVHGEPGPPLKWLSAAFAVTAAPHPRGCFFLLAFSPRVPPLPWMLGQMLVPSAVQPLEDASVTQPALAGHRLLFSPQRARARTQRPAQAFFGC